MDNADKDMTPAQAGPVLRRMIARRDVLRAPVRQAAQAARVAVEISRERAAGTAMGRAAERSHRLPVFVEKVEFAPMTLAEMQELLPERALLAVVEGGADALGVVAICPGLLSSLIEMQALGRVTSRLPAARRVTRTDAAISADFVNGLLADLGRELAGRDGLPQFATFRYATYLDDPRPLTLMLEDAEMMRLTLRFRIGSGGQRDGSVLVALPMADRPRHVVASPAMLEAPAPAPVPEPEPQPRPTLASAMQDAPIPLHAVLCRRTLTLRALRMLTPGTLMPLPQNALEDAWIETRSGQLVARGRLGEADGQHALRLRAPGHAPVAAAADLPPADLAQPDAFREIATAPDRVA